MANVINLQFSDTVEINQVRLDYTGNEDDDTDIGYFIGTDANTTAYTNLLSSGEVTSGGAAEISTTQFDRTKLQSATPATDHNWLMTNYVISLTDLVLWHENNTSGTQNFVVEAFNERTNVYEQIGSFTANSTSEVKIAITCTMNFYSDDIRVRRTSGAANPEITEIYMYGFLRRKNGGSLGLLPPPTIFEDLADSKVDTSFADGWVKYVNFIIPDYRYAFISSPVVLTGTFTLGSLQQSNVIALDPNSADRDVILPQEPHLDHYVRFISLDGSNNLNIKETAAGPTIVTLSNATTILTAEFIWEQTDQTWHATY